MKSQETLSKIMELLNLQDEVKLAKMKLENGTTLEAEAFEANQEVFIVAEDGEKIALPVGDYTLEDGKMLSVVEEGVIAAVGEAKAEEESPEAPVEEEMAEDMEYVTKEEFMSAVSEIKAMIEQMMNPKEEEEMSEEAPKEEPKEELSEEVKEEAKEELSAETKEEEVELNADEPATKPIKHSPESAETKEMNLFAQKGRKDTLSRILDKLAK